MLYCKINDFSDGIDVMKTRASKQLFSVTISIF